MVYSAAGMSNPTASVLLSNSRCSRRPKRKRTKKSSAVQEAAADLTLSKGNKEARRSSPEQLPDAGPYQALKVVENLPQACLQPEARASVRRLMLLESVYQPKTDFLFRINSASEDKVDAKQRDEAIFNLRFLHKFYNLSPLCFAHAVNIADRFIVKVKVKPKYMACLATAAYLIATKMVESPEDWPSPEKLVLVARCGGSANDLERMEAIIRSKLQQDIRSEASGAGQSLAEAVTPLHFLLQLRPESEEDDSRFQRAVGDLEMCLCSVAMYNFGASQLALCVARRHWTEAEAPLLQAQQLLELTDADLLRCDSAIDAETRRVQCRSPTPRALVWQLSRRTIVSLQRPSAAAHGSQLQPITEDWLEEENLEICRLFD